MSSPIYKLALRIDNYTIVVYYECMLKFNSQPIIESFGRMTQEEIAEVVGVSRHTVRQWLHGSMSHVTFEVLEKFAIACNVKPGEFFTLTTE